MIFWWRYGYHYAAKIGTADSKPREEEACRLDYSEVRLDLLSIKDMQLPRRMVGTRLPMSMTRLGC